MSTYHLQMKDLAVGYDGVPLVENISISIENFQENLLQELYGLDSAHIDPCFTDMIRR